MEDTAHLVIDHASGARSVLFATVANVVDSPVTMEIVTEQATLYLRGDLTISYADGRVDTVSERVADVGRAGVLGVLARAADRRFLPPAGRSRTVLDLAGRGGEVPRR